MIQGIILVCFIAFVATFIAHLDFISSLALSPLIIGIVLGMIYANSIKKYFSDNYDKGIEFSMKQILRIGIVLYGFRLTFTDIEAVGINGVFIAMIIVASTFIIGYTLGIKVFKLDRDITILTSAGASICGAAAVLATEPVIKAQAYKTAVAVSTVVVFGTIAMIIYPLFFNLGLVSLNESDMGIYIGATLHEVAHVVGSSSGISTEASQNAIIIKMIRVMMLAPFLLILSFWIFKSSKDKTKVSNITIPWFAIFFILVVGFNSFDFLASEAIEQINILDTFLLTMAMSALGMNTTIDKFKNVGLKPIYLASVLFLWLIFAGYFLVIWLY